MDTFSALLALCAGNSLVTGEFPSQRPVTRSFNVYFDLCLNKRLCKQSIRRWFETPLSRHCKRNITLHLCQWYMPICIYVPSSKTNCMLFLRGVAWRHIISNNDEYDLVNTVFYVYSMCCVIYISLWNQKGARWVTWGLIWSLPVWKGPKWTHFVWPYFAVAKIDSAGLYRFYFGWPALSSFSNGLKWSHFGWLHSAKVIGNSVGLNQSHFEWPLWRSVHMG